MLRRQYPLLFHQGKYAGLSTQGPRADHICAFQRFDEEKEIVVAAAREFVPLITEDNGLPIGRSVWKNTLIETPVNQADKIYRNILTNEYVTPKTIDDQSFFDAAEVLNNFSVGLLVSE